MATHGEMAMMRMKKHLAADTLVIRGKGTPGDFQLLETPPGDLRSSHTNNHNFRCTVDSCDNAKWNKATSFTTHLLLARRSKTPAVSNICLACCGNSNGIQPSRRLQSAAQTPSQRVHKRFEIVEVEVESADQLLAFEDLAPDLAPNLAKMVKLTSARQSRMYGPPGTRDLFENLNAFLYLLGTVLFAAGVVLLLPSFGAMNIGLWMILIGMVIIVLVNFHDLHAHLAGIDYNFRFLTLDAQLGLVELAAPLVEAIGSILLCIATVLMIRANKGVYDKEEVHLKLTQAFRLVVAGAALWFLGAIHNAFQGYEKTGLRIQTLQKAVSLPFVAASELLLISGVLALQATGHGHKLVQIATWLALVATSLLVVAAVVNAVRVVALQQVDRFGNHLESLRGGAEEELRNSRATSEPLLSSKGKYQSDIEGDQSNAP